METAIIGALLGLVTGVLATAYKSRKDLELQYDIKLREERIPAYKALWKELDRLAYYSPPQALTYGVAKELSIALRTWYFGAGGLLLSEHSREPYFDLQRALKAIGGKGRADHEKLPDETQDALKQLGSRLRTSMTDDVATRVGPLLTQSLFAWVTRRRTRPLVTVTRGWSFDPVATGVWRVSVANPSSSEALMVEKVWLDANGKVRYAQPLDRDKPLERMLFPREAWQGFVPDEPGLMAGVDDPFRAFWAQGPGWRAGSRSAGDAPASPIPADRTADPEKAGAAGDGVRDTGRDLHP